MEGKRAAKRQRLKMMKPGLQKVAFMEMPQMFTGGDGILKSIGKPVAKALGVNAKLAPVAGMVALGAAAPVLLAGTMGAAKGAGNMAGKGAMKLTGAAIKAPFQVAGASTKALLKAMKKKKRAVSMPAPVA
jgi:hypothetical protein